MKSHRFVRSYAPGEDIFLQGDAGHEAFVVEHGRVAIWQEIGGSREPLAELGAGEVFGEMALFSDHRRVAGATAVAATQLRAITRQQLDDRLEAVDPLLRHVLGTVMARLRGMLQNTQALTAAATAPVPDGHAEEALRALRLEHAIVEGIEGGEFELHYQPILALDRREPVGYEALARWRRDGQLVPPLDFIPAVERSGLARRFGQWVGLSACDALARGLPDSGYLSINVSTTQFGDGSLLDMLAGALTRHGVRPQQLRLEVTESQLLHDWRQAQGWLEHAQALGIGVMLDDFGTGYSSLAYLHRLPLTALKIDRSFVDRMVTDTPSRKILRTIASLAEDLEVDCIAEGIETEEQVTALRDIGVPYGQGYLFGRPQPLAATG